MKKYIISSVCLLLVCLLLSLHVSAATASTSFFIDQYVLNNFIAYYSLDNYNSFPIAVLQNNSSVFKFSLSPGDCSYYVLHLGVSGRWMDSFFFNETDYDAYYLTYSYRFGVQFDSDNHIFGGGSLKLNDSSYLNPSSYFDFDYAVQVKNSDGSTSVTYRVEDPQCFYNSSPHGQFEVAVQFYTYFDYDWEDPVSYVCTYTNEGITLSKEFNSGGDSGGSDTTAPDSGDSGGSGDSGDDITPSNVTVIVNKIDAVGNLLADLKQAGIEQIELQATQNVLISQLPDKLKDMSLGTVTRPNIPTDKLSGLQEKEDLLYDKSDQLLGDKNSVIDGDFHNYVKPVTGNTSAAYDLFFERLFDIPWINKMVFISLWFGLGGFVLRLGRKLN